MHFEIQIHTVYLSPKYRMYISINRIHRSSLASVYQLGTLSYMEHEFYSHGSIKEPKIYFHCQIMHRKSGVNLSFWKEDDSGDAAFLVPLGTFS